MTTPNYRDELIAKLAATDLSLLERKHRRFLGRVLSLQNAKPSQQASTQLEVQEPVHPFESTIAQDALTPDYQAKSFREKFSEADTNLEQTDSAALTDQQLAQLQETEQKLLATKSADAALDPAQETLIDRVYESKISKLEAQLDDLAPASSGEDVDEQDNAHKLALQAKLPNQWIVVISFALCSMLLPFCIDMYLPAFPAIAAEYDVPVSAIEFSLSVYFIGIALGQFLWGPLSDAIGRRFITLLSFVFIFISSALISNISSLSAMYFLRFWQGFFCASLLVTATAILRDIYHTKDFVRLNGLVTLIFFAAPFLAPLVGSFIAAYSTWHYIFYAISLGSAVCFVLFWVYIPESINPAFKRKLAFGRTLVTMKEVLTEKRSFWMIALMTASSCMIFSYVSMASGVFQQYWGISAQVFPFLFMLNIVGQTFLNWVNTKAVDKISPAKLLQWGVTMAAITGLFNMLLALFVDAPFWLFVFGIFLSMSATPLIFLNAIALYLELHYKHSGTATSLVNVARWLVPGIFTALVQQVNPHGGYTMLFSIGLFSFLTAVSFVLYRRYEPAKL